MQQTTTGSAASAAREKFEERDAQRKAGEVYNKATKSLNEQFVRMIDYGRENPGKAALIAFGVGLGAGLIVTGSFSARNRRSRRVETVMNALSALAYNLVR
jgi:hypothetical protein